MFLKQERPDMDDMDELKKNNFDCIGKILCRIKFF